MGGSLALLFYLGFKVHQSAALLHPTARTLVFTGNGLGTNPNDLSISVLQPPSVTAQVSFVDNTIAVVQLQTASDLPEGDLIISVTLHTTNGELTESARVAIVSQSQLGMNSLLPYLAHPDLVFSIRYRKNRLPR